MENVEVKLFIICGHGDGDCGATGNGYQEAERVRALAGRIQYFGGDRVVIGDTTKNWYREKLINTYNFPEGCMILELHMDSDDSASVKGGHVIIKEGYSPDQFDKALAALMKKYFPGRANTIVGRSNLANVNRAANKGYNYRLLESGFISNATDVNTFNTKMDEIAKGILNCFDIDAIEMQAGWIKDDTGWWYKNPDGSYPKSQWWKLDAWYYFDQRGYALCNTWQQINGNWYYFDEDCRMVTGWRELVWNGVKSWYFFDTSGNMLASQWINSSGKDYYLTESGAMATNAYVKSTSQNIYYWVNWDGIWEPQWDTPSPDLKRYKLAV